MSFCADDLLFMSGNKANISFQLLYLISMVESGSDSLPISVICVWFVLISRAPQHR